jgi:hypothetical protein
MPVHVSQIMLKLFKSGRITQSHQLLGNVKLLVETSAVLKLLN